MHVYTYWEERVKSEGLGGSQDRSEYWPASGGWTPAHIKRPVKYQTSELICDYFTFFYVELWVCTPLLNITMPGH